MAANRGYDNGSAGVDMATAWLVNLAAADLRKSLPIGANKDGLTRASWDANPLNLLVCPGRHVDRHRARSTPTKYIQIVHQVSAHVPAQFLLSCCSFCGLPPARCPPKSVMLNPTLPTL